MQFVEDKGSHWAIFRHTITSASSQYNQFMEIWVKSGHTSVLCCVMIVMKAYKSQGKKIFLVQFYISLLIHLLDLVKFVIRTLISRVHMTLYIYTEGYTVPKIQGTHDKLHQIPFIQNLAAFKTGKENIQFYFSKYTVNRANISTIGVELWI